MKTKGCAHTCTLVGVPDCWGGRVQYDHHPLARRRAVKPFLCGARTSRWLHCLGHPSVFQRQFSMRARENAASNGCRGVRLDGPWRHGVEIIAYLARRCTRLRIAIYAASGAQRDLVRGCRRHAAEEEQLYTSLTQRGNNYILTAAGQGKDTIMHRREVRKVIR